MFDKFISRFKPKPPEVHWSNAGVLADVDISQQTSRDARTLTKYFIQSFEGLSNAERHSLVEATLIETFIAVDLGTKKVLSPELQRMFPSSDFGPEHLLQALMNHPYLESLPLHSRNHCFESIYDFSKNKEHVVKLFKTMVPTQEIQLNDMDDPSLIFSPECINPATAYFIEEIFADLASYHQSLQNNHLFFQQICVLGKVYGYFDDTKRGIQYRQILTKYIRKTDQPFFQELGFSAQSTLDSKKLTHLKNHIGENGLKFNQAVSSWNTRDLPTNSTLIRDILRREARGIEANFQTESSAMQGTQALAHTMFVKQTNGYLRNANTLLSTYGVLDSKTPDKFHSTEYRLILFGLREKMGLIRAGIADGGENGWNVIASLIKTLTLREKNPLKNTVNGLLTSSEPALIKISLFLMLLENHIVDEIVKNPGDSDWHLIQELKRTTQKQLSDFHDLKLPLPLTKYPANHDEKVAFSSLGRDARNQLRNIDSELGVLSIESPLLNAQASRNEERILVLQDSLIPNGITLLDKTRVMKLKEYVSQEIVNKTMLLIPLLTLIIQLPPLEKRFSTEQMAFFLSTYIPATIFGIGVMKKFSHLTQYIELSPDKYNLDEYDGLRKSIGEELTKKRLLIQEKATFFMTLLILSAGLSLLPEIENAYLDSGIADRVLESVDTLISSIFNKGDQNENLTGVTRPGPAQAESFHPTGVRELPSGENFRYHIEYNGSPPAFLIGQACEIQSAPDIDGCFRREDGEYFDEKIKDSNIVKVSSNESFVNFEHSLREKGYLFLVSYMPTSFMEVPVGFRPEYVFALRASGSVSASWNPFGGIKLETGGAEQLLVAFSPLQDPNAISLTKDQEVALQNYDPISETSLQLDFAGKEKLIELSTKVKQLQTEGTTTRDALDYIMSELSTLGIEYGLSDYSSAEMKSNAEIAGSLLTQKYLVCNQSSWLAVTLLREAGYKDVFLLTGYANYLQIGHTASDRDKHAVTAFRDIDGIFKIYNSTLPSLGQVASLSPLTDQEKSEMSRLNTLSDKKTVTPTWIPTSSPTFTPTPSPTIAPSPTQTVENTVMPTMDRTFTVTSKINANIRSEGSIRSKVLASVKPGSILEVLNDMYSEANEGFIHVKDPATGITGWISKDLGVISDLPNTPATSIPSATPSETATLRPTNTSTIQPDTPTPTITPTSTQVRDMNTDKASSPTPVVDQSTPETSEPWIPLVGLGAAGAAVSITAALRRRQRGSPAQSTEGNFTLVERKDPEIDDTIQLNNLRKDITTTLENRIESLKNRQKIMPIVAKYFVFLFEFYKKQGEGHFASWEKMATRIGKDLGDEIETNPNFMPRFQFDANIDPLPLSVQNKLIHSIPVSREELLLRYSFPDSFNEFPTVSEKLRKRFGIKQDELNRLEDNVWTAFIHHNLDWNSLLKSQFSDLISPEERIEVIAEIKGKHSLQSEQSIKDAQEGLSIVISALQKRNNASIKIREAIQIVKELQSALSNN